MNIRAFVNDWLSAANAYDMDRWVAYFHPDATLDDPSVGSSFIGHEGIRRYFEDYFIGYNTQTKLVKLTVSGETGAHVLVDFTGGFPGGQVGGTFELTFRHNKIVLAKAELV
ncbi:nuclear transport factor 2 family protein [Paraflavitalea pollutisoli]|uniref:nuclear transport factor 2 family protein n=1 Tax=Paraflavitalea pollutisoli TaxID=3034143 RepID=UPI0023EC1ABD|nr:nuclear transport factor 2 family protein [Paraflavitalea sp. H1-2-19X]